tara:strand:+ start:492 stop:1796 length:1305 start_codon:yes stop_codon:yes gene_type:complete
MKLFNQLFFDKLSLLLFSIIPISLIVGNAAININILLIDILFLIYCIKLQLWGWLKKDIFLYLIILYIFLILNSLYSYYFVLEIPAYFFYQDEGFLRSFLFIKYLLLIFAFNVLLKNEKILDFIHKSWLIIITIIIFDVFFEKFTGRNIIGNVSPDGTRIVSFFKDELVVGGLIFCFGFASSTYFINNSKKIKLISPMLIIFFLLIPLSVFVTGEKSNFIKSILLFFIIIYFLKKNKQYLNYKILIILIFSLTSCFIIFSENTRIKYQEIYSRFVVAQEVPQKGFEVQKSIWNNFSNIKYFAHYDVAIQIFKNYPILGVGNKNFRKECPKEKYFNESIMFSHNRCSTHPHQVHLEILSEQGILGYFLILGLILWLSIKGIKIFIKNKNVYHLNNIAYILLFFIPLLPGGGIFSTFNGTLFWVIFSLMNLNYEKK